MANINEILARAASLRDETALNSIDPERAGGIMYDTLLALNELWLQQGAALVISKIYASVAAMEADTAPVSDLTGKPLRPGQIVVIASSDSDNGSVYRYNGTESPSWSLVGSIGNLDPVDSLDSDSTTLPLAAHQGKVLDGKISQLGQKVFAITHEATTSLVPSSTANGWKLIADGVCAQDESARIKKYLVSAGSIIFLKLSADTPGVYQFQTGADIPTSAPNTRLVGAPVTDAVNSFIEVPVGATYLIISEALTNTSNEVKNSKTNSFAETNQKVSELGNDLDEFEQEFSIQAGNLKEYVVDGYYYNTSGTKSSGTNYSCLKELINTENDILFSLSGGTNLSGRCFDASMQYLGDATISGDKLQLQSGTKSVGIYWTNGGQTPGDYSKDYLIYDNTFVAIVELQNNTAIKRAENFLAEFFTIREGFIDNSYYNTSTGNPSSADTYARTNKFKVSHNQYRYQGFFNNGFLCFNSSNAYLGEATIEQESQYSGVVTLLENTAYVGLNFQKSSQPSGYKENGVFYNLEPYVDLFPPKNDANILYGKKWVVVGDSFSAWSPEQFASGKYSGRYKTYKYFIALRNNMVIWDMTQSGRTMAYPSDHTFDNAFAKESIYQSIPADADYITIMLGINDAAHLAGYSPDGESTQGAISLGTIDSTDTGTFYGAWNVVMQWIFENRPLAHIGIIITNGLGSQGPSGQYSQYDLQIYNALKDIVERWNVPYIDLNGGDGKTPMMQRGIYPEGTPSALIAAKWNAFATTPTGDMNGHTNVNGHLYESTFIENFLRSL